MDINDLKYLIRSLTSRTVEIIILHLKSDVHFYGVLEKIYDPLFKNESYVIKPNMPGRERFAMYYGIRKTGLMWIKNPVDAREFADLLTNIDGYKEMTDEQIEDIIENHVENYEDILRFYENSTNELQITFSI